MFDWVIEVKAIQDHWVRIEAMKPGYQISFATDPNMQEDMGPYREALKRHFSMRSYIVWTVKDRGRWIILFKRLA